jgi:hypothetical protein
MDDTTTNTAETEQFELRDVVRFRDRDIEQGECEILGCTSSESMEAGWYCVAGPNIYGWFQGSDLELVYRPASRAEVESLRGILRVAEELCLDRASIGALRRAISEHRQRMSQTERS